MTLEVSNLNPAQFEAMRPGARNAVLTCMGVAPGDRVFVLTDEATRPIGQALYEQALQAGAEAVVRDLENFVERPVTELPEAVRMGLEDFRPTVTFYAAASQQGEVSFRMAFRSFVTQQLHARHGHMPGITYPLMLQGMRTDYHIVAAMTEAVYRIACRAAEMEITTPDGTDLRARFSPELRWVPCTGLYREPGAWGNLPEGETFTCPERL
jgi:leucyl aminopeptidase (aminopeptidase T)